MEQQTPEPSPRRRGRSCPSGDARSGVSSGVRIPDSRDDGLLALRADRARRVARSQAGRYVEEDARLRESMSGLQRQQADAILSNEQNKVRMMIELVRRQAQIDKQLHLAIPVDSGVMYLEQDGALLREMPVQVGPERRVGTPPDTVYMVAPRGTRTVERILDAYDAWEIPAWVYTDRGLAVPAERALKGALGPAAVVLVGGTVIYSLPSSVRSTIRRMCFPAAFGRGRPIFRRSPRISRPA